jgi:hypothetical protein
LLLEAGDIHKVPNIQVGLPRGKGWIEKRTANLRAVHG